MSKKVNGKKGAKLPAAGRREQAADALAAKPRLSKLALTLGSVVLRSGVWRAFEHARSMQTEEDKAKLATSPSRKIAGMGVKVLAARSVPGALLVGAGIVAQSLYRQRKARKQASLLPRPIATDDLSPED